MGRGERQEAFFNSPLVHLAMIVRLKRGDLLRLHRSRGATIDVLSGRVWVSEEGCLADSVVGAGERYRVERSGLVLVGTEHPDTDRAAEITVQALDRPLRVRQGAARI